MITVHWVLTLMLFPRRTLAPSWYKDQKRINYLTLNRCDVNAIEKNTFNIEQFAMLRVLRFEFMRGIYLMDGALNGLTNLRKLRFYETWIVKFSYRIFGPINVSLESIMFYGVRSSMNVYNLFGSIRLEHLTKIHLMEIDQFDKILTSNLIAKVPIVEVIMLYNCGIEAIADGAFDHVARTLTALILRKNKLKALPRNLFDSLVIFRHLNLIDNPWECTCDLLEVKEKVGSAFDFVCNSMEVMNCTGTEGIIELNSREQRKCCNHFGTNFARIDFTTHFQLKRMPPSRFTYVKNSKRCRYYLIAFTNNKLQCFSATGKYAAIPIIDEAFGVCTICAMDSLELRTVWPLNCVPFSLYSPEVWINGEWRMAGLSAFVAVNFINFVLFVVLGAYLVKHNLVMLKGVDRVYLQTNPKTKDIEMLVVLPSNWRNSRKLQMIKQRTRYISTIKPRKNRTCLTLFMKFVFCLCDFEHRSKK